MLESSTCAIAQQGQDYQDIVMRNVGSFQCNLLGRFLMFVMRHAVARA